MGRKSKSSRGYAVFEDVLRPCWLSLSLEEAFHQIMAQCGYEPIWETEATRITLRFRHLDGPQTGSVVMDGDAGCIAIAFESPLTFGTWAARNSTMQKVLDAGLCGWRGLPMDSFYTQSSIAQHDPRRVASQRHGTP
jgi:hypothetical protein